MMVMIEKEMSMINWRKWGNNVDDDDNEGQVEVLVRIVGYVLNDFVTRIGVEQILNNYALDERVREELVCHLLTNNIHPPSGCVKLDDDEDMITDDDDLEEDVDGEMEEDAIMSSMMIMREK